jgi:hypothetical protein
MMRRGLVQLPRIYENRPSADRSRQEEDQSVLLRMLVKKMKSRI